MGLIGSHKEKSQAEHAIPDRLHRVQRAIQSLLERDVTPNIDMT